MKLTTILFLAFCLLAITRSSGQTVTFSVKDASIKQVFKEIQKQTGLNILVDEAIIQKISNVTLDAKEMTVDEVLGICLKNAKLTYSIVDGTIIIKQPELILPPDNSTRNKPSTISIIGSVTDEDGNPVASANVLLKGTKIGIATDKNGEFTLRAPIGKGIYTLEFSYVGHEKAERELKGSENVFRLSVVLKKAISVMDEIQATAYSKTSRRFSTGDISTITYQEIAKNPVQNVLQALQGRVAGMFVTELTGMPDGAYRVQIRSLNTLSSGAAAGASVIANGGQPLYILDGVEYPTSLGLPLLLVSGVSPRLGGNSLNYVDPASIESINVLKGADATAIYGSRGAFGVIIITTKKAKPGKPTVNLNIVHGFSEAGEYPTMMNTQQYLEVRREALANDNRTVRATDYDLNGAWDTTQTTKWKDFFYGDRAPVTRVNLTYTGGNPNVNFLMGANYGNTGNVQFHKGSIRTGGMNFSLNTASPNKKFMTALSGSYFTSVDDMVPVDFSGYPGSGSTGLATAPNAPYPYLPDGKLNWANPQNPAAVLNTLYRNGTDNLVANAILSFIPIKGLTFIATGGFNLIVAKEFLGQPSSIFNPATFTISQTYSAVNQYRIRTFSADPRVEFNRMIWGKGRLTVTAGGSLRDARTDQTYISGTGFPVDALLYNPTNARIASNTSYSVLPQRYIGGFAILNFRWADKYILSVNGRRDGSSLFGNDRQFGNFGSVAGAWIVSEEPWFKGLKNAIDFLKLKGSYGTTGGSAIEPYSYINAYGIVNNSYGGAIGAIPLNLSNPFLHWETDRNLEAGLTVGFLKERINAEVMYYFVRANDQLVKEPLASITGFIQYTLNSPATIQSYGTEFTINIKVIDNKELKWYTRFVFTLPRTKLISYPGIDNLASNFNYIVGKPITGIKLFQYAGVNPATGYPNYYKANGAKVEYSPSSSATFTNADRAAFIDLSPKFYGSFLNTLTYKNITLDFLINVTKRTGPNYLAFAGVNQLGVGMFNFPVDIANKRWKNPGDITDFPKPGFYNVSSNSTGAYSDASYVRMQNLSIAYQFSSRLIKGIGMSALQVYLAGQNLFTLSSYKDLDPEVMLGGRMPPLRTFTFGINVTF